MSNNTIIQEFEQYKGQFVITDSWDVQRLIAVASDEYDYYWVYWNGAATSWCSCVGSFIPLKGKIDEGDYNNLIRLAKLNHHDQFYLEREAKNSTQEAMYDVLSKRIREKSTKIKGDDEYITEICWKIN